MRKIETSLPKTGGTPLRAASAVLMIVVWFAMAALLAYMFIVWPTPALFFDVWFDVLCLLFLVPLVLIPIQVVRYFRRSGNSARHSKLLLCLALAIGVAACLAWFWPQPKGELDRTYASPDGRYEIVVYRKPLSFAMPGQGSDAPGYFQLRDVQTGRVLHERKIEMVQLVDRINWSATNVDVHLLADWRLP